MKNCIYIIALVLLTAGNSFAQWTWQNPLPHGNTYNDIKFISQSKGFVAGDFGQFYMTTNQGLNWSKIDLGTTKHIRSINMINNNTGWICGRFKSFIQDNEWWNKLEYESYRIHWSNF